MALFPKPVSPGAPVEADKNERDSPCGGRFSRLLLGPALLARLLHQAFDQFLVGNVRQGYVIGAGI